MDYNRCRLNSFGNFSTASGVATPLGTVCQSYNIAVETSFFFLSSCTSFHIQSFYLPYFLCFFWSYFILPIPMRKCFGKHPCTSSAFPIAILDGTLFFRSVKAMKIFNRSAIKLVLLYQFIHIILVFDKYIFVFLIFCLVCMMSPIGIYDKGTNCGCVI